MQKKYTPALYCRLCILCAFLLTMLIINDTKAQEPGRAKKKTVLPSQDLAVDMLTNAQYNFTTSGLKNISLENPTSLQFGPDSRLYVSQQNGIIKAFTIKRNGPNDYTVTDTETIDLINQIPNYNDDGTLKSSVNTRQVTGILVTGTSAQPILYVSSSDSRIGGGSGSGDKNLDTNSGIISRLTRNGSSWAKVDLVRGLPRSEENHSVNGMQFDERTNMLYVAVGGFTNAGAPSNNFAFITEYALAAAILSIDLNVIDAMPTKGSGNTAYKYNLPTLDDPTRANNPDGTDVNDPFGGNDGLNQAVIVQGGPVQVYSPGYRNAYDLVITKTPGKEGRMYTIDNGANSGWGGHPDNEGADGNVTNNYVVDEPGSTGPGPNDPKVNNLDNLHYIGNINSYIAGSHYGGHPTPIRANPAGAGLYTHNGTTGVWRTSKTGTNPLPANWPPVPLSMANPIEGDFQNPGETDLAILTFPNSTNGLTEYTASNFNGALQGALLAADYGGKILKISLTEDGSNVTNSKKTGTMQNNDLPFASGFGSQPLDVTAQGDHDIFPGSVWAATYGSNVITIFEPADFVACSGTYSTTLDDDNDGYSNADEIDNGTNPCSASSLPTDFNQNFLSDMNDPDDDSDGINDNVDLFGLDAQNGLGTNLPVNYELFNNYPGTGFFGLGFTGLMTNKQPDNDYLNLFDESNLIAGGAVGAFSVVAVSGGDALGALNSQQNAFQFGINVNASTGPFTVEASMLGPFFNGNLPQSDQSQGIYIGTGDQDNYLKIVMNAHNGSTGVEVVYEEAGQPTAYQYTLKGGLPSSYIEFYLSIDPATGTVQPKYSRDGGATTAVGSPIQVSGALLNAIQSTPALAVGIIATSRNAAHFTATWDKINITADPVVSTGAWQTIEPAAGAPTARHENGFVEAGDKFYLLGGRGIKPVQAYDPIAKTWTDKAATPIEFHHFQAVTLKGLIYVVGAFTGNYPNEVPVSKVYIYNPVTDKWFNGPSIPEDRRRGSAGVVVYNDKIYLVSGITNGHSSGHVTWFDEYDPATNTWKKLPDAPRARDHFNAVIINSKLYVAGGRRSSHATGETYSLTVPEVDVFDFETNVWTTLPSTSNLLTQRAGTATVVLGDELVVIGGESMSQTIAHKQTEALNVKTNTWRQLANLQVGRHATQAIVNNNGIYIAAGNGSRGGGVELSSQEAFYLFGPTTPVGIALNESRLTAPADINFGAVAAGTSQSNTITVTNEGGNQAIVVHAISVSGASTFSYTSSHTLPVVIPAGGNFSIMLNYSPTAIKSEKGQLLISHSGQTGSTFVNLSGGPNTITASPTSLHFFSQQAGTTSDPQQVVITNNSAATVEITSVSLIGVNNSEFRHDFTGTVTLEAGASTNIGITFTPALLGTKAAQLKVIYSGTEELIIGLTGEGIDNQSGVTALYRINSGGKEFQATGGLFSADAYFAPAPGYVYSKKKEAISGTEDDDLYRYERSATADNGSFSYAFPAAAGRYRVVLHFAELYWAEAGRRVFDVRAEGALVLDDYDVFAKAGGRYAAVSESFEVEVSDGTLDLLFSALAGEGGANRPKVSAIEVYSESAGGTNVAPVANAGPDQTITLPESEVVLSGSGSDADGTVTGFQWSQNSGPSDAVIENSASATTKVNSLQQGDYVFSLIVKDDKGALSEADIVTIHVNAAPHVNQVPVANAGPDQTITLPVSTVELTGSGTDPDGSIASYTWSQEIGPSTAEFSSFTIASPTVSGLIEGNYVFSFSVTDNEGLTSEPSKMTVFVLPASGTNQAPVADAGPDQSITLPVSSVQLSGSGTDIDGTVSSYLWSQESGPSQATFSSLASASTAVSGLVEGSYIFSLIVTDNNGAESAADLITVTVHPAPKVNQVPVANAGADQTVTLPVNSIQLAGGGTDADGTIASYAWRQESGPSSAVFSNLATASPTVSNLVAGTYTLSLVVTDNEGAESAPDHVTVTVKLASTATALYRINSGGKEFQATGGLFSADAYFAPAPGYVYSKKKEAISGTEDDDLYRYERSSTTDNGSFSYALPVPAGRYRVVLHFAELYWAEAGRRVFDVRAEGALVLDDYDVFARAGGRYAAVAESFEVEVGDGTLDLLFSALAGEGGANRPKVSAIEVYSYSEGMATSDPDVMSGPEPSLSEELSAEGTTLTVYPNPFDKVLNIYIESEEVQDYDIIVYDVMGQELYRGIHSTETAEAGVLAIDLANQNTQSDKLYLVSVVSRTSDFRKVVKVLSN